MLILGLFGLIYSQNIIQSVFLSFICNFIGQKHQSYGLFEIFKIVHSGQRNDNFIVMHFVDDSVHGFAVNGVASFVHSILENANNILGAKLLNFIKFRAAIIIFAFQMQQNTVINSRGNTFNVHIRQGHVSVFKLVK